jgi:arylsulfatase A-like enzyme
MAQLLPPPVLPAYGSGSLGEVVPSLLAALSGETRNVLNVPASPAIVLLVIDGLGWDLLSEHQAEAPFLAAHLDGAQPITSGYPSSTATSLAMLSTARPPIAHGLTGYTMAAPGLRRAMNTLAWTMHGPGGRDLRAELPPESVQPLPTLFMLAAEAGVRMTAVGPDEHVGSGLSRAILRGGRYEPVSALDDPGAAAVVRDALGGDRAAAVYAYHPALDAAGHRYGPGSDPWRAALRRVDAIASRLAAVLPDGGLLAVTADHGSSAAARRRSRSSTSAAS